MTWYLAAFLSAVFAALTSILAKIGIKNVDSNLDVGDMNKAREIIGNISKDIPVGVIYKNPKAVNYLSRLSYRGSKSLLVNEVRKDITSIKDLLAELV